jgi:ring-1,2-phenylacetyl-CoA epoxidase subunit PaaE
MADDLKNAIISRGINSKQVHTEHFVNAGHTPGEFVAGTSAGEKKAIIHLRGQKHEFMVPDGGTILDVLVKAKLDPPYSCTSGACATCMGKVLSGKVTMDACYALDESEIKSGYILTCQSRPESDLVEVTYDL